MTLKQIMYVKAVSEAGSFVKAAEQLFISQSSLSESIKKLEVEYDMVLFERSSKGIFLTHQGEEFLKDIQLLSDFYQDIDDKYKKRHGGREHFSVSSLHHVSGVDAFDILVKRQGVKNYRLGYLEGSLQQVMENVGNNLSDVGVLFFTTESRNAVFKECGKRNIIFQHLKYSEFHVYVHNTHPLANATSVTFNDIHIYPFVSYDECNPSSSRFTNFLRQWNKSQQLIYVSDRAMAYSLVSIGSAYITGSGYLSAEDRRRGLVAIPITDLDQIEIGWISNPNRVLCELAMEYIEILKSITI